MVIHTAFDLVAWIAAYLIGRWVAKRGWLWPSQQKRTLITDPFYFIALGVGAIGGAIVFGSANLKLAGLLPLGHSIAGALVGGIVAVEIYKWAMGMRGSTGVIFVAPLALGIAIGRWGCFLAGLADFTYGTPTALPWGVDFGDGIRRHPVQLYESTAMLIFLIVYLRQIALGSQLFLRQGFYLFVGWYGIQRFVWEFLKPYPAVFGPFNLFHVLCVAMVAYSLIMIGRYHELHSAIEDV